MGTPLGVAGSVCVNGWGTLRESGGVPMLRFAVIEHLYIHVPFCPKVCPYCSFYKESGKLGLAERFVDAVLMEAGAWSGRVRPKTVFVGGGTPTALSPSQLLRLFSGLRERLDFSRLTEWTIEMNPATVSADKARVLMEVGVNRVSMGVQSWDDALLATLGRVHSSDQAKRSYETLRESGFDNVNLDLIFGIPGQTKDQWRASLETTIALGPEHVSAYCLTYEEDTAYFEALARGEFRVDEESDAEFFETTMEVLEGAGYGQYEISNHALVGRECWHNLAYWRGADYLGLGPSAFSTVGSKRWKNRADTTAYIDGTLAGRTPVEFEEVVDPETRRSERVAFGLRTREGVTRELLTDRGDAVARLAGAGLIETDNDTVRLSRRGRLLADAVAGELMVENP